MEQSTTADAAMRIFNSDGSEAEMCGNGLRCFIHFLKERGIQREIYHIDTKAGVQKGWFVYDEICLELMPPHDLRLSLPNNLHFVNTGVPHAVRFVEEVDLIDVERQGRALRYSSEFSPAGANINFVTVRDQSSISIRTYERGVERETLACGTGATAAALITHKIHHLSSPLHVLVRSGERIKVFFTLDWSKVAMMGPVTQLKTYSNVEELVVKEQMSIMHAV